MASSSQTVDVPTSLQPLATALESLNSVLGSMLPRFQGITTGFANLAQTFLNAAGSMGAAAKLFGSSLADIGGKALGLIPGMRTLGEAFGSVFSSIGSSAVTGITAIGSQITQLGGQLISNVPILGRVVGLAGEIGGAFGGLVGALGGVAGAIGGMLGGILSLGESIAKFVQAANPAIFQLFQNVVADLTAVIGQGLAPILQVITQIIRLAADSLASFIPQIGAVIGQLAGGLMPIFQVLFNVFSKIGQAILLVVQALAPAIVAFEQIYTAIYEALEPVLDTLVSVVAGVLSEAMKLLAEIMKWVAPYIIAFARIIQTVFTQIQTYVKELFAVLGINLPEFAKPKEGPSVGAAVAKGTNIGSVEGVLQSAMKSAFAIGTGAKDVDSAVKTASIAEELNRKAAEIETKLKNLPKEISETVKSWVLIPFNKLVDALTKPVAKALDSVTHEVKGRGIDGSGRSTGSETVDAILGGFGRLGGWLEGKLNPPKGTAR